ncbi:MAG: LPS export ABC transporter periplasmic protein LptC [Gammaproteobacteria bacterium]|nr:LPS export ABC transporter periplasmic protein LptC [Gammaproteobacteria bacterium]MAY02328.1 LPS export ABC transporter periplasmic protein LptC [Gammaproteobacteria bacterium]|tara:strand:- start:473 stop:1036 length:564 start_codon:yes stop_codon:yes gene_type:complete
MRPRSLLLLALFFVLFYLLNTATEEPADPVITGSRFEQEFDYYMSTVDSTRFNAEGESRYRLQAERIVHFPSPELTTIDAPQLVIYEGQSGPWFLSAAYGTIEQDLERAEEKLELSENVLVQHTDNNGETYSIYTEALTIYLDSRYLITESDVLMETENREISSQGMTADLMTKHLTFLGNVRGRYE